MRWRKALGSGYQGGFGLRPGLNRLGLFCAFDDEPSARAWLKSDREPALWRARARQFLTLILRPVSSRGSWSGYTLASLTDATERSSSERIDQPVASLTRASIRPSRALPFWSFSPAAEQALARAPGCELAVGLGEAPLLRQATFSLWRDQASMDAYARSGAHQEAIRAAYGQGFFSESMFVRFEVIDTIGELTEFSWTVAPR